MSTELVVFQLFVLLFSAIIHEYSHGWAADQLGDQTAKYAGRLTLNPKAHIDLYGTILVPLFLYISHSPVLFGWAKPVPYNPYNLTNKKWGPALVSLAGPASNLFAAICFGLLARFLPLGQFTIFLAIAAQINVLLMVFNLMPIPPLDGSTVLSAFFPRFMDKIKNLLMPLGPLGLFVPLIIVFFLFNILILPIADFIFYLIIGF